MSSGEDAPVPYQVVYSERVRQHLFALGRIARQRGDSEAFLAALSEFHRRLCLYPQFGDPLADLKHEPGQVWIGIIRPLAMRYAVLDDKRLVAIAALPVLLAQSKGWDSD